MTKIQLGELADGAHFFLCGKQFVKLCAANPSEIEQPKGIKCMPVVQEQGELVYNTFTDDTLVFVKDKT